MASREEKLLEEVLQEVRELRKLCNTCIEKRLIISKEPISEEEKLEARVSKVLKKLGITAKFKGYKYCKDAILMIINSKELLRTVNIYKMLAKKYETKYHVVERAIRYAIEKSSQSKTDLYKKIFLTDERVANSEFILTIAEILQTKLL